MRSTFWHSDGTHLYSSSLTAGGLDDATATPQILETAWIPLAGLQGYERVYSVMLLAQAMAAATVAIEVGFDYESTYYSSVITGYRLTKLSYSAFDFVGTTVTGGTSGAVGTIVYGGGVGGSTVPAPGAAGSLYLSNVTGTFIVGEVLAGLGLSTAVTTGLLVPTVGAPAAVSTLIGRTSGATATVSVVTTLGTFGTFLTLTGANGSFTVSPGETIDVALPFTYTVTAASNPLRIEHKLPRQKCGAVRFRLTVTPAGSSEAVRLTALSLSVGVKKGMYKLPSSKRF